MRDVHATVQQPRLASRSLGPRLHDLPSQRLGIVLAEHAGAAQVPILAERGRYFRSVTWPMTSIRSVLSCSR